MSEKIVIPTEATSPVSQQTWFRTGGEIVKKQSETLLYWPWLLAEKLHYVQESGIHIDIGYQSIK